METKIRYEKVQENGNTKKVTEPYLVSALSFTEAEARIIEEMTPFISGEFKVTAIKITNYSEVVSTTDESADKWYKAKVNFVTLDEKSGAEKKTSNYLLLEASDLDDAKKRLNEHMKGTMADWEAESVSETKIMDVYPYFEKESN
jgi:hypothetical protein